MWYIRVYDIGVTPFLEVAILHPVYVMRLRSWHRFIWTRLYLYSVVNAYLSSQIVCWNVHKISMFALKMSDLALAERRYVDI